MPAIRLLLLSAMLCASILPSAGAAEVDVVNSPVPVVLQDRFHIQTTNGAGDIPIRVSRDWTFAQTDVTRAVIIIHGWPRRDIDADKDLQQRAGALADNTLFITPQFLTATDVTAQQLYRDGRDLCTSGRPHAVSESERRGACRSLCRWPVRAALCGGRTRGKESHRCRHSCALCCSESCGVFVFRRRAATTGRFFCRRTRQLSRRQHMEQRPRRQTANLPGATGVARRTGKRLSSTRRCLSAGHRRQRSQCRRARADMRLQEPGSDAAGTRTCLLPLYHCCCQYSPLATTTSPAGSAGCCPSHFCHVSLGLRTSRVIR